MKKRKFLKFTIWTFSIVVLLFAALVIHIAMVSPQTTNDSRLRQLSRIDFKQEVSAEEAEEIKGFVGAMEGVEGAHFNLQNGAFVYIYNTDKQDAETVYKKLMAKSNYKAERYIVDEKTGQGGCPMHVEESSFTGKLTAFVTQIF